MTPTLAIAACPPIPRLPDHNEVGKQAPAAFDIDSQPMLPARTNVSAVVEHLRQRALGTLPDAVAEQDALYLQAVRKDELYMQHQQQHLLEAMRNSPLLRTADQGDAEAEEIAATARKLASDLLPPALQDDGPAVDESHQDFFDRISRLITRLDAEWIQKYSDFLADYVALFAKIGEALKLLSNGLGTPDDKGNVEVDFKTLRSALDSIALAMDKVGLGPPFATRGEAQAFLDELGLPDLKVIRREDGTYQVGVDPTLVRKLKAVFPELANLSPSQLTQLMANKDTLLERFNHLNRAVPEKYQRQLQMWDQLVKILSSTIDSITEADRVFIQSLVGG